MTKMLIWKKNAKTLFSLSLAEVNFTACCIKHMTNLKHRKIKKPMWDFPMLQPSSMFFLPAKWDKSAKT